MHTLVISICICILRVCAYQLVCIRRTILVLVQYQSSSSMHTTCSLVLEYYSRVVCIIILSQQNTSNCYVSILESNYACSFACTLFIKLFTKEVTTLVVIKNINYLRISCRSMRLFRLGHIRQKRWLTMYVTIYCTSSKSSNKHAYCKVWSMDRVVMQELRVPLARNYCEEIHLRVGKSRAYHSILFYNIIQWHNQSNAFASNPWSIQLVATQWYTCSSQTKTSVFSSTYISLNLSSWRPFLFNIWCTVLGRQQ